MAYSNLRRNPIDSSLSTRAIVDEPQTVAELFELPGVYGFNLDDRPIAGTVSIVTDNTAATPFTIVLTTPAPGQVFVDFNTQRGMCIFHADDTGTAVLCTYSGAGSNNTIENAQGVARSTPITGYAVGANTALAATDTILEAFGKVQGQLNSSSGGVADQTHAATGKTTPVDADEIPLADSAASWALKKLTFANLWLWIKSKFDSLSAGSALGGTEKILMAQSGNAQHTTPADLKTYIETNPTKLTSPVAWTPTCTGFGTVSALTAYSWRVGSLLFFEITFTAGTTTATEARVSLGYNGTNNNVTTVSTYPTLQIVGLAGTSSSSGYGVVVMAEPSKQYIVFGIEAYLFTSPLNKRNGDTFANGTVMSIHGSVRINGW